MGRPLNKKYFGNRNTGSASVTTDNGIGGGFVASVTLGTLGAYTTRPTVTFSVPDKEYIGAVRATGTVTSEILSVVVSGTMADYVTGDEIYFGDAVITVTAVAGEITGVAYTNRGSFTTLASGAQATTTDGTGTGAEITVTYRAKAVVITEPGSGYTNAADAAPTFTQSVTGTTVLGTDTGNVGSTTNQENAITMIAYAGGEANNADVIRQVSTNRYKVKTYDGISIVQLQGSEANADGEASILATDSADGTYYVTKLTAHKATLTRGTGTQFATGQAVQWTFGAATEGSTVKIANA